jgi:hypothetical protein
MDREIEIFYLIFQQPPLNMMIFIIGGYGDKTKQIAPIDIMK